MATIRFRLRTLFIITALVIVALFVMDNLIVAHWSGSFDLSVQLKYPEANRIDRLEYLVVYRRELAEGVAANPRHPEYNFNTVSDPSQPFLARVECYGRSSQFGRDLSYGVFESLIVIATFEDGSERIDILDIPRERGVRTLAVTLPKRN